MPKKTVETAETAIFKALADESRLKILSILLEKDSYTEYLSAKLNLTAPTVSYHMDKLEKAGIVLSTKIQHYTIYSINYELMDKKISDLIRATIEPDSYDSYEQKIIDRFFAYGKLTHLPTQIKKREIIIGHIAEKFEPNRVYIEKEVVALISEIYDDYCTVKHDLIGMGFMEDLGGKYKRKLSLRESHGNDYKHFFI